MAFRTSPSLGPQLDQTGPYYWDSARAVTSEPSYRLGNTEPGNDGHRYVHVLAGAALTAGARVNINETTWVATANASGTHMVPNELTGGVANGAPFQARLFTL